MTSGPRIRVQETVLHAVRFQDERSRVPEAWQGSPLDLVGRQHLVRAHKRGTPAFSPWPISQARRQAAQASE